MPSTKRLLCLANSRKLHDRCVAGKEWNGTEAGNWVRPISARDGGAVSERERRYEDGSDPQVLDVMDVPVLQRRSEDYQTENWLLDPKRRWMTRYGLPILAMTCLIGRSRTAPTISEGVTLPSA